MLTIQRKPLSAALAAIKPAIDRKAVLPILRYVKAEYTDNRLTLTATNLESYASRSVDALPDTAAEPWPAAGTCLEFAALEAAIKGKADLVRLKVDRAGAYITTGAATARVPILPTDEFPPAPAIPENPVHWLTVDVESFANTFGRIALVASHDDGRPVLTGVHLIMDDCGLNMQAADGFRLLRTRYAPAQHSEIFECLVPYRAGKLLEKMTSQTAQLIFDPERFALHILGTSDDEHIATQLIAGNYPDLDQVIPVKPPHRVVFLAEAAADALAPFKAQMGILRVAYTDGALSLAIRNEDYNIDTSLPCTLESETPADLSAYNPDFIKSIILAAQRKGQPVKVVMEVNIPVTPAKFTTPDTDPNFVAVLMPMHIDD